MNSANGSKPKYRLRRRKPKNEVEHKEQQLFRIKRIHSCRNFIGQNTKYKRSNLRTEVALRKEKLTPGKIQAIKEATDNLSEKDVAYLVEVFSRGDVDKTGLLMRTELHDALEILGISCTDKELDDFLVFADADGSKAIDVDEWLMLVGMLIQPPYDKNELETSFEILFNSDINGNVACTEFCSIMQSVLQFSLSSAESENIPAFLNSIVCELDPHRTGLINSAKGIDLLLTPY